MGLLRGSTSVTRFNVVGMPNGIGIDWEPVAFREIETGSEIRESFGAIPFPSGDAYEIGARRWAFRVRIDTLRPDATQVREQLDAYVKGELEAGAQFVGPKKRKELKDLAEEAVLVNTSPKSKIIEVVIDGDLMYVGSTSKSHLGIVMTVLRRAGVEVSIKTPWLDRGLDFEPMSEPCQSMLGAKFLNRVVGDDVLMVEPESGHVQLVAETSRVTLRGAVTPDLHRHLANGADMLSAKLLCPGFNFRLDATTWRLSGLKFDVEKHEHWTNLLDERLEKIAEVFDILEGKYDSLEDVEVATDREVDREVVREVMNDLGHSQGVDRDDAVAMAVRLSGALGQMKLDWGPTDSGGQDD